MTAQPMRVAFAPRQARTTKRKLLWSCAAAAILVTAGTTAQKARAQAFQGTPTLLNPNIAVDGAATRTITSPTTETITVGSPTATINWIPSDNDGSGTIDFLPNGNVATFTNDPGAVPDFTVLNRILPSQTRPIALNGTVISQLQDLSQNVSTGGHVWFYSPNGIIVGASAVFNVGSLLLTVNDPVSFSATSNGFSGHFVAGTDSTASVTIDPGAKINATSENSYVAIVAPRVVQAGEVGVNGSAAYVAGEDVTLTMNQGLFDIRVDVGTSDPNDSDNGSGVVHTGTTGGPASTGAGDNHRIYMVAVPKNQALTMLLSGNAGFTPASSASLNNGTIVLAAGSTVAETSGALVVTSPSGIDADLKIGNGTYTSDVRAFARGDIDVLADTGDITFSRDVSLTSLLAGATGRISLGASGGNTLSIGRSATLQTNGATFSSGAPEELTITIDGGTVDIGGNLTMFAGAAADGTQGDVEIAIRDDIDNDGILSVGGQTLISTSASAAGVNPDVDSANGFAGNITIEASNGGSIGLGNTTLFASANGQDNSGNGSGFNQGQAGAGFAGSINISAAGGTITITGNLSANADGIGGRMLDGGLFGGTGFGGFIDFSYFDGGIIHVTGNTFMSALGVGGGYIGEGTPTSAQGGSGFGGTASITGSGTGFNPGSITIDGDTTIRADGTGGSAQSGGFGLGGRAGIDPTDGTVALGPTISVSARGTGGNANVGFGGNGGGGFGGDAFINALAIPAGVEQFATAATVTGGNATIDATGTGGNGGAGNGDNLLAGSGGDGFGGEPCQGECSSGGASALASVDGGSLTLGNVTLFANGVGGNGGVGGNDQTGGAGGQGFGGGVQIGLLDNIFSPTGAPDGEAHYGNVLAFASGNGGNGGTGGSSISGPLPDGDGGLGQGGSASLWSNSLVTASSVTFFANGNGGNGANGGSAFGGSSSITSNDAFIFINDVLTRIDGSIEIDGDVTLEAAAASGNGSSGTTGDASGGTAELAADGGDVTIGGDVFLSADGDAEDGVNAGFGEGGLARVEANDGAELSSASLTVQALGEGGNGTALAGSGNGGTAQVRAHSGASITTGNLTADASGTGGNSIDGGSGSGGLAEIAALELDSQLTVTGLATVSANGVGGTGATAGTGGDGFGGSAKLYAGVGDSRTGGATVTVNNAVVHARGLGGTGGTGGTGSGGGDAAETEGIQIGARLGTLTITGTLMADAGGVGGAGLSGAGGNGFGGNVLAGANFAGDTGLATVNLGTTDLFAVGVGGNAGGSGNAGGDGFGGEVEVGTPTAGSTLTATALSLHAGANGGLGGSGVVGGRGGDANGGHALIDIAAGDANLGVFSSFARGVAGNGGVGSSGAGGAGGDGFAGLVELNVTGTLTGTSYQGDAAANGGIGGAGTTQGAGGSAEGGSTHFNVYAGGDAALSGPVVLNASAVRGTGSSFGGAVGGFAELQVSGSFSAGAFTASANGTDAGDIHVSVADGSSADLGAAQMFALGAQGTGSITIDLGGAPVSGGGGFLALGLDNILLTADSLALNTSGDIDISSLGGASIDVAGTFSADAGGAMTLDDLDDTAVVRADIIDFSANSFSSTFDILGRVIGIFSVQDLNVTSTVLIADEMLTLSSDNDVIAGDLSAGLAINLFAGHDITAGDLDSGGDVTAEALNDITLGDITAAGRVDLLSDGSGGFGNIIFGDVNADILDFSADGTVTGGDIVAVTKVTGDAQGAIALGDITVPGPEAGGDFSVGIASETSIDVGNVSAVGRVGFATLGDLTTGNIAAGPLFMALVSGDVTVGSVTTAPSGQVYIADSSMFLAAGGTDDFDASEVLPLAPVPTGGSITIAGLVSTGQFRAAAGGSLTAGNITAGSSIDVNAGDNVSTANLAAGTNVALTAGDNVTTGNIAFGQSVTLGAGNDIVAGDLDGGHNVTFTAGNNLTVGDVGADGTASFTAVGLASFLGVVAVPTITVTSSDINVPFGGSLGLWGTTNLLTLNAVNGNPIIIGNSGALAAAAAVPQYVLDENGDLQATTIVINAVGANGGPDPDIIVHNVGIDGSLASNPAVSHVVVNTDASVLIDGLVLFSGALATDSLAINAGDSIQINTTDGGGIAMVNAAEDRPSGLLTLTSDNIWAGSQSLLDQLAANVNFAGRDVLVGTNPGAEVPEGYLIAGGMALSLADTLFVQNSGAGQAYAGITVGAGGLTIATTGAAPAQVVAYGRKMNPDGTFVTGNQFFALVNFTKATSLYTAQSELNECLINTGCSGGGPVGGGTLGPEAILGPVDLMGNPEETIDLANGEDLGDSGLDGEDGGSGSADFSTQLFSTAGLSDDALVDEGVTSGGDNNQWDSQVCKPTSPDQPCPEPAPPADKQEQ